MSRTVDRITRMLQRKQFSSFLMMRIEKKLWIRKIPRQGFVPTKYSRVCIDHFAEVHILRSSSAKRDDGTILTLQRSVPKLTTDAYPSIFLVCPGYLTETQKSTRRTPADHQAERDLRD